MADWYISSTISKKYDLYLKQSDALSADVDSFLNSRINDFNATEEFLDLLKSTIEGKKIDNIETLQTKGQDIYSNVAKDFNIILTKYFFILNESQKKYLKSELEKENKEILDKMSEESHERFKESFEFLLDDLSDSQIKILKKYQSAFRLSQELRLESRQKLHQIMFSSKIDKAKLTESFEMYVNKTLIREDDFKAVNLNYKNLFQEMISSLSQEQISYAKKTIDETKEKIRDLKKVKF